MISVVSNISSLRAQRNLNKTSDALTQNINRLSSGLRINRAGDDAAGSAISSQMTAYEQGLKQLEIIMPNTDIYIYIWVDYPYYEYGARWLLR